MFVGHRLEIVFHASIICIHINKIAPTSLPSTTCWSPSSRTTPVFALERVRVARWYPRQLRICISPFWSNQKVLKFQRCFHIPLTVFVLRYLPTPVRKTSRTGLLAIICAGTITAPYPAKERKIVTNVNIDCLLIFQSSYITDTITYSWRLDDGRSRLCCCDLRILFRLHLTCLYGKTWAIITGQHQIGG